MATSGKQVGRHRYIHAEQVDCLEGGARELVARARHILDEHHAAATFNVVRVDEFAQEVAFLHYPHLGLEPFPALANSWRVNVSAGLARLRSYSDSLNPPVLHRTELLLPPEHPMRERCQVLTESCERIGLFDNPVTIGFRRQWHELIARKGYVCEGFELIPIGNSTAEGAAVDSVQESTGEILRHLTALTRATLSAPVQSLLRDGLLTPTTSFFDYGCGKGDDVATLAAAGYSVSGWDPHFRPNEPRISAKVVNIGFVINVIESVEERIEALQHAYALATQMLSVAAMVTNSDQGNGRRFGDGVITRRSTFQKYYSQAELRQFVESTLAEEAYPAAPGIFYVFRDRALEQTYLLSRSASRTRVDRALVKGLTHVRALQPPKLTRECAGTAHRKSNKAESPEALQSLSMLWRLMLEYGRVPENDELPASLELKRYFGSVKRAVDQCLSANDASVLERAQVSRSDDILVMLALRSFDRRRKLQQLEGRLARDIRRFFGSLSVAEAKAYSLLFSLQDKEIIRVACEQAASDGLGWLEPEQSLQLHTSLVERLPASLRVYIGCATIMAGDLDRYDLVKAHIQSGKVSVLAYDDFLGKPLPALRRRVKVRLRDQTLDVFDYDDMHPPTLLFRKSRYINEEFSGFAEQSQFEQALEELKLFDLSGYGPAEEEFAARLAARRYEVIGYQLVRSTHVPSLDAACGAHFRYRDFIQCGETWQRVQVDNTPKSPESFNALNDLASLVLDPVIEYFGAIKLTYGFASPALTKHISARIAPDLDQHAACEITSRGRPICGRRGAAADFLVEFEDMRFVAQWIVENCPFDRLYYYGADKALHVSIGPENSRQSYELIERDGRRVPRPLKFDGKRTLS